MGVSTPARAGPEPLDLVSLSQLMARTAGRSAIVVGLIDGPIDRGHPALAAENVRLLPEELGGCRVRDSACLHGTFVAGILAARRGTGAPGICSGCTLLVRPIFGNTDIASQSVPSASPEDLAAAILDCIGNGAQIINISAALIGPAAHEHHQLDQVLDVAARRGVIIVVAAGNEGNVSGSILTRHHWVIPVVPFSRRGLPLPGVTLGRSIGRWGLGAPGEQIASLAPGNGLTRLSGSSVAAPFVTGAAALIWSELPNLSGREIRFVLVATAGGRRGTIVPPLLDAWSAYRTIAGPHWS